jgi:hypothetical protein
LTANDDLVAVAFALAKHDTRHEAQRVVERGERLVIELFALEHADALRDVDQRGRGLGSGDGRHIRSAYDDRIARAVIAGHCARLGMGWHGTEQAEADGGSGQSDGSGHGVSLCE